MPSYNNKDIIKTLTYLNASLQADGDELVSAKLRSVNLRKSEFFRLIEVDRPVAVDDDFLAGPPPGLSPSCWGLPCPHASILNGKFN